MSFIDSRYIGLISVKLQKFSRKKEGLYTFRCPYCGDSQKHKNKTRGYIYKYKNDHNFKCHNCGVSRSLTNFLKDQDPALHDQYVFERYKEGATGKGSNTPTPKKLSVPKPVFKKRDFDLKKISELNKSHPAREFLENRKIPQQYLSELYFTDRFKEWTNTQKKTFDSLEKDEPRIIIPLKNKNGIFGFQGRSISPKSKLRYITVMLDDDHPKLFGLDRIDEQQTIYIAEGPFDSYFLTNAIAMCGSDVDDRIISNRDRVYVFDNEPRNREIVAKIASTIERGHKVVIWPDKIEQKDINDMFLTGLNVQNVVQSNVYSGLHAKTKLISWKKT